jgi:hypothetical protein
MNWIGFGRKRSRPIAVLSRHLLGRSRNNYEKLQSGQTVSRQRFKPSTSGIWLRYAILFGPIGRFDKVFLCSLSVSLSLSAGQNGQTRPPPASYIMFRRSSYIRRHIASQNSGSQTPLPPRFSPDVNKEVWNTQTYKKRKYLKYYLTIPRNLTLIESLDSSVGIANRLRAGRPRSQGSIPGRDKHFSLLHNVQTGSETYSAPYAMGSGGWPPGAKAAWA